METTGVMLLSLRLLRIQQTFIFSLNFSFYIFAECTVVKWGIKMISGSKWRMHENTGAVNCSCQKTLFLGMNPTTAVRTGH